MAEIIEKTLSRNDVAETGAHQSGPYVGTSRTVPDFFPALDLTERDPHEALTFLDPAGRSYHFELRYWTVKDEYHLSHMTQYFRDHGVTSGDVLVLRRDDDGTLHVDIRPAGEAAEGQVLGRVGAWRIRSLPAATSKPGPDPEEEYERGLPEGAKSRVEVNRYERSRENRDRCLEFHGTSCAVCGLDFGEEYGDIGDGYIHVHHVIPLPELDEDYVLDPRRDLVPVCPNCHAMLHRRNPPYTVEDLRVIRRDAR